MGKPDPVRPRVVEVLLPTRSHWRTALANAQLLKNAGFSNIFIRKSMSAEERRQDFELRQQVHERNNGKAAKEWVVYHGEMKHVSELPKRKQPGNQ
ncbi:hypothetical protein Y032_0700g1639 [Ancylostoma ceylanicum]|uniref:Uncharacterized protein n=1 Tax=Ancylostoma ceylanicum TaxID=53326 RepID=A0A016WGF2_9BILA|nr:hypothetical protein Y032_0700g1639 [Ancylostoma ceylanicum]